MQRSVRDPEIINDLHAFLHTISNRGFPLTSYFDRTRRNVFNSSFEFHVNPHTETLKVTSCVLSPTTNLTLRHSTHPRAGNNLHQQNRVSQVLHLLAGEKTITNL